jgi:hypothetical protein
VTIRFRVEPRDVPPELAARRLGLTLAQFEALLPRLLSRGFPASDPDTGHYDLDAIDRWRERRHRPLPGMPSKTQDIDVVRRRLEAMGG